MADCLLGSFISIRFRTRSHSLEMDQSTTYWCLQTIRRIYTIFIIWRLERIDNEIIVLKSSRWRHFRLIISANKSMWCIQRHTIIGRARFNEWTYSKIWVQYFREIIAFGVIAAFLHHLNIVSVSLPVQIISIADIFRLFFKQCHLLRELFSAQLPLNYLLQLRARYWAWSEQFIRNHW